MLAVGRFMMKKSLVAVGLVVMTGACNLISRNDRDSSPTPVPSLASAPVFVVASAATTPGSPPALAPSNAASVASTNEPVKLSDYSQEGLGPLPDNCSSPAVVMMAVPKNYYSSDTFDWRHVRQVALANPDFNIVRNLTGTAGSRDISFSENEHKPTTGVALVAHCSNSKTCLRFAAAYRTVVPTAKLTLICGPNPNIGARITGGKTVLPETFDIKGVLPDKKDVQSLCVRLAACKAARDHALGSDETQACMMKPTTFKTNCALKKTCEQVLTCSEG